MTYISGKLFKRLFVAYCALITAFLAILFIVHLIPSDTMKNHIGDSLVTLKSEGIYHLHGYPGREILLDNFTDTLMLNTAFSVDSSKPFSSMLSNIRYDGAENRDDQIANLEKYYNGYEVIKVGYERYWNGYLVYLRPLLSVTSYSGVRMVLALAHIISFALFLYLGWQKLQKSALISILLGLLAVDYFHVWPSMHFSAVFLIGLISSVCILKTHSDKKSYEHYIPLFFIIGGASSFFDLMTAPLVALGLPLATLFGLKKDRYSELIAYMASWAVGFAMLWVSKWVIAEFFYARGAMQAAISQVLQRSSGSVDDSFSRPETIKRNIFQLIGYSKPSKIAFLFIGMITALIAALFRKKKLAFSEEKVLVLIFMGLIPYVWYFLVANQSYIHVWFTYRQQFLAVFAGCMIIAEFVDGKKIQALLKRVQHLYDL